VDVYGTIPGFLISGGKFLLFHPNPQFPVIIYREQWAAICEEMDRLILTNERLKDSSVYFYVCQHGLKNGCCTAVAEHLAASFDLESPYLFGIQLHMAVTFKSPNYAVMLRQSSVGGVVRGSSIAYYRLFGLWQFCQFANGHGLRNHSQLVTNVIAYDAAQHVYKTSVQGSQSMVAILGKMKYCTKGPLKSIREALNNKLDAYERYLRLRVETPQEMRVEGVFNFYDELNMENSGWPSTACGTYDILADAFISGEAIVVIPKDIYAAHIEQYCLRAVISLRQAIESCEDTMTSLISIQRIHDNETIMHFLMNGTAENLNYGRFKQLLANQTVKNSIDDRGVVQFRDVAHVPNATRAELYVSKYIQLPYPWLANNVNIIVDYILQDSRPFNIGDCVTRLVLLTAAFSRQYCGLTKVSPKNARVAFSSERICRLRDPSRLYRAKIETNTVSMHDVCNVYIRPQLLVVQLCVSHCMRGTQLPSDWDSGEGSFVYVIHQFVYKYVDIFPMYLVSNNSDMCYLWYHVRKIPKCCNCCDHLIARTLDGNNYNSSVTSIPTVANVGPMQQDDNASLANHNRTMTALRNENTELKASLKLALWKIQNLERDLEYGRRRRGSVENLCRTTTTTTLDRTTEGHSVAVAPVTVTPYVATSSEVAMPSPVAST